MKKSNRADFKCDDVGTRLRLNLGDRLALIDKIRAGLRVSIVDDLARLLDLPTKRIMLALAMSPRTLARRKTERRLHKTESDHVVRIALILNAATHLYSGDVSRAAMWICRPNRALAGAAPLDFAHTSPGYQEVCDLIGRIEHGIVS